MKIGLQISNVTWPGGPPQMAGKIAEIARAAERRGFYSVWVMDHFFQIVTGGPHELDMLEGYTALGLLGGRNAPSEARHDGDGRRSTATRASS